MPGAATSTAATNTFDNADRINSDTAGSYSYDELGRVTTMPAGDSQGIGTYSTVTGATTIGYWGNDLVRTETEGGSQLGYTLDPTQSRISTINDGTTITTDHYTDSGDSPAWASTAATATPGTVTGYTRNIEGPDGNLAATVDQAGTTTLRLANLHGDIVATAAPNATTYSNYTESTEYGAPRNPATAQTPYGWTGAKRRSDQDLAGLVTMGVRLYNPTTGRFLQVDPVPGGTANDYAYPADPINQFDFNGQWCVFGHSRRGCRGAGTGRFLGQITNAKNVGHTFRTIYRHADVSVGYCFTKCYSVGFQHGWVYAAGGQKGWATPGVNLGWSYGKFNRNSTSTGGGGGAGWGGYAGTGESGISWRPGGGWYGTNRIYHAHKLW